MISAQQFACLSPMDRLIVRFSGRSRVGLVLHHPSSDRVAVRLKRTSGRGWCADVHQVHRQDIEQITRAKYRVSTADRLVSAAS